VPPVKSETDFTSKAPETRTANQAGSPFVAVSTLVDAAFFHEIQSGKNQDEYCDDIYGNHVMSPEAKNETYAHIILLSLRVTPIYG